MAVADEIGAFADVPLDVAIELDRKVMSVREILLLTTGSVIKLTHSAGENIDLLVGGTLVGFGEIVIMEDIMGVRITDFSGEE